MALRLITAPAQEPVNILDAKSHLRVDIADDDVVIDSCLAAAREYIETTELSAALITQTWELVLDAAPGNTITFPRPPLQSVTSVTFTDVDGNDTVVDEDDYIVDADSWPGRLVLKADKSWPSVTLPVIGGVVIRFVAGYGDAPAAVPMPIRQAILLLTGDFYENRENSIIMPGQNAAVQIPFAVKSLLASYRRRQF